MFVTLMALAIGGALGAWSADVVVDGAPFVFQAGGPARDATMELKRDSGTRRWTWVWFTGAGSWVGDDFDNSTLSSYRAIRRLRFYARGDWPNRGWDGFRVAFFDFRGNAPGSRLWPTSARGYFVKPSGLHGHVWVEINIGWTCPTDAFAAAEERFYNRLDADPFAVDNNTVLTRHSWQYYQRRWSRVEFPPPYDLYRNVTIRVVVDNGTVALTLTSVGRVKLLYR